jgi:hypothetical protein
VDFQFINSPKLSGDLTGVTCIVTCITGNRVAVARGTADGHIIITTTIPSTNGPALSDLQFVIFKP